MDSTRQRQNRLQARRPHAPEADTCRRHGRGPPRTGTPDFTSILRGCGARACDGALDMRRATTARVSISDRWSAPPKTQRNLPEGQEVPSPCPGRGASNGREPERSKIGRPTARPRSGATRHRSPVDSAPGARGGASPLSGSLRHLGRSVGGVLRAGGPPWERSRSSKSDSTPRIERSLQRPTDRAAWFNKALILTHLNIDRAAAAAWKVIAPRGANRVGGRGAGPPRRSPKDSAVEQSPRRAGRVRDDIFMRSGRAGMPRNWAAVVSQRRRPGPTRVARCRHLPPLRQTASQRMPFALSSAVPLLNAIARRAATRRTARHGTSIIATTTKVRRRSWRPPHRASRPPAVPPCMARRTRPSLNTAAVSQLGPSTVSAPCPAPSTAIPTRASTAGAQVKGLTLSYWDAPAKRPRIRGRIRYLRSASELANARSSSASRPASTTDWESWHAWQTWVQAFDGSGRESALDCGDPGDAVGLEPCCPRPSECGDRTGAGDSQATTLADGLRLCDHDEPTRSHRPRIQGVGRARTIARDRLARHGIGFAPRSTSPKPGRPAFLHLRWDRGCDARRDLLSDGQGGRGDCRSFFGPGDGSAIRWRRRRRIGGLERGMRVLPICVRVAPGVDQMTFGDVVRRLVSAFVDLEESQDGSSGIRQSRGRARETCPVCPRYRSVSSSARFPPAPF